MTINHKGKGIYYKIHFKGGSQCHQHVKQRNLQKQQKSPPKPQKKDAGVRSKFQYSPRCSQCGDFLQYSIP